MCQNILLNVLFKKEMASMLDCILHLCEILVNHETPDQRHNAGSWVPIQSVRVVEF